MACQNWDKQQIPSHRKPPTARPPIKAPDVFEGWYTSGTDDFIYKDALAACRASKTRLAKYLPSDEILLLPEKAGDVLSSGFNALAVKCFIQDRCTEATKSLERSKVKWLSEATCSIASVAAQLSDILAPLVPQSPEYTIPFGCLMIIFNMLVAKQDKREQVMDIFDKLQQRLPSLELYRVVLPSRRIKQQLAQTYIHILDLIVCMTEWCAIGKLSKLVDVVALKPKYDFHAGLQQVEGSYKTLEALSIEAIAAVLVDSHETLKNQSRMIDYIADQTEYLATNITTLSNAVEALQLQQNKTELAQAISASGDLIDALFPEARSELEERSLWQHREFRLAPKDHWEVNGILDFLQEWRDLAHPSILAIFGPSEGRDTWVTEFSLDLMEACKLHGGLVASAMCDRPDGEPFTPTIVIKTLICRLLEQNPRLFLEAPGVLNLRAFRRTQGFNRTCSLFESVVATLAMPLTVIIDRVDCCEADPSDENESQNLVGFLSKLITIYPRQLKVIITSGDEFLESDSLFTELAISSCMIASRTRNFHKEAFRPVRKRIQFEIHSYGRTDYTELQPLGLEQLYRMRRLMHNKLNFIHWTEKLVPATPRQKMICRDFRLQPFCGEKFGGYVMHDRQVREV